MAEDVSSTLLPPPPHVAAHWARVREEVGGAIAEVPLYAGRTPAPKPSDPNELSVCLAGWLSTMPTVAKRELRRGFPKSLVRASQDLKAEMARGAVEIIATSGTTSDRLQVLWEWSWWDPQEREAMRLNRRIAQVMRAGRIDYRELVLTTPVCGGATCHIGNLSREERTIDGMLFLNQVADPSHWNDAELDRMVSEWNDLAPEGVEADPAYLAALASHAAERGLGLRPPAFVTVTYELATRAHRRAIRTVVDAPLYTLYGATEAGVLFMECEAGRLHHNARHSHVELVDLGEGLGRVVMSTLGRAFMPLVRYDLGDVVRLAKETHCACGLPSEGYLLERIEGRFGDCLAASGRLITPAMLDDAIDHAEPTVSSWQLVREPQSFRLRVVGKGVSGESAARSLERLLDSKVAVSVETAILPEGSGKYRLVKP